MIENNKNGKRMEKQLIDKSDAKWAHPLIKNSYPPQLNGYPVPFYDPDFPQDVKLATREKVCVELAKMFGSSDDMMHGWKTYEVTKGCPEESDAPTLKIDILEPEKKGKKKRPVVISINGGGLVYCSTILYQAYNGVFAEKYGAIVVSPIFRTCIDAPYPAAINDLHAAYQWILDNAETLNADPDNITIFGTSSGAHLGLALTFRLKRYGYRPRGCVASMPITDERMTKACSRTYVSDGEWSGENIRDNAVMWLGKNYGSPFIGPEAYVNHATVDECKGLCPIFINTFDLDPDCQYNLEFVDKLLQAGVYVDYHITSGCSHGMGGLAAVDENVGEYMKRENEEIFNSVHECMAYDLRRELKHSV